MLIMRFVRLSNTAILRPRGRRPTPAGRLILGIPIGPFHLQLLQMP
jgi:hypothetical protein